MSADRPTFPCALFCRLVCGAAVTHGLEGDRPNECVHSTKWRHYLSLRRREALQRRKRRRTRGNLFSLPLLLFCFWSSSRLFPVGRPPAIAAFAATSLPCFPFARDQLASGGGGGGMDGRAAIMKIIVRKYIQHTKNA